LGFGLHVGSKNDFVAASDANHHAVAATKSFLFHELSGTLKLPVKQLRFPA
jgi:hypothetical protein